MQRVGQILKQAREKKGITVAEVAHITKINAKTIEAIENGTTDGLPQKAFIRGFVQTYAKYLGLDTKEIIDLFVEEMGQTKPVLPGDSGYQHTTQSTKKASDVNFDGQSSRKFLMGGLGVLLIVFILILNQVIKKYEKEGEVPSQDVINVIAANSLDITANTLNLVAATTLEISSNTMTDNEKVTPSTSTTSTSTTSTSTSRSTTSTKPTTTTSTTRTTTTTSRSTSTTTSRTTTTTSRTTTTTKGTTTTSLLAKPTTTTTLKPRNVEVIVEALDNVSLGYRIDGGAFQQLKLGADQVHTFKASQNIAIDVSDGGAINVIVNGIEKGVPGTSGQPVKLKYP